MNHCVRNARTVDAINADGETVASVPVEPHGEAVARRACLVVAASRNWKPRATKETP